MFDRLDQLEARYEDLGHQMSDPTLVNDQKKFQTIAKQHRDMEPTVEKFREYRKIKEGIAEAKAMLAETDPDIRAMAQEELAHPRAAPRRRRRRAQSPAAAQGPQRREERHPRAPRRHRRRRGRALRRRGLPHVPPLRRAAQVEGRSPLADPSPASAGLKDVTAIIEGDNVYSQMKYESGVHRVQRVPATETQGRVHTSAITVAVLPEAEEVDIKIEAKDLRIDTFCSSGPGGQSVNTTYSAVRITHLPTNTVVSCQDEKSQIKNREKAMRVLRARLYEVEAERIHQLQAKDRKQQVGSGDRSEKIRTYNFPQNRLTDHRIGLTNHQLAMVMEGMLQPTIDALIAHYTAEKLKAEATAA